MTFSVESSSSDDCVFVKEVLPSPELVAKAESFMLPKSFYNYLTAPPCPGCIGCDPDAFDFDTIGNKKTAAKPAAATASADSDDGKIPSSLHLQL